MKKLGNQTMAKIEQLIATPTSPKPKSPGKTRPMTARQIQTQPSP
jgi:hypothetical protein